MREEKVLSFEAFRASYAAAQRSLPGGVSASIRFNKTLGFPFYVQRGEGARVQGVDGRWYLDMCMSHGAAVHGHNNECLKRAVADVLDMGIVCSYETPVHRELAELIVELVPCAELVRYTLSGTEAVKYMLRVAREYTGKSKVLKFEGHFHGYDDYILYNYATPLNQRTFLGQGGSYLAPYRQSGGIPDDLDEHVIVIPFNDTQALEQALEEHGGEIAAVIMEPIALNMGCVFPEDGYLAFVREATQQHGVLLLFDEILSGFRTGTSCAQGYYGVTPDLCTLGKALSGGLPLSVFTGRREIMEHVRPLGEAEHSGTFMGHLVGVSAARESLRMLKDPRHFERTHTLGERLYAGLREVFERTGTVAVVQGIGDRFGIYFGLRTAPRNYEQAAQYDAGATQAFVRGMFKRGVYMLDAHGPKPVHHGFSAAHTEEDIDYFLGAAEETLVEMRRGDPAARDDLGKPGSSGPGPVGRVWRKGR